MKYTLLPENVPFVDFVRVPSEQPDAGNKTLFVPLCMETLLTYFTQTASCVVRIHCYFCFLCTVQNLCATSAVNATI